MGGTPSGCELQAWNQISNRGVESGGVLVSVGLSRKERCVAKVGAG